MTTATNNNELLGFYLHATLPTLTDEELVHLKQDFYSHLKGATPKEVRSCINLLCEGIKPLSWRLILCHQSPIRYKLIHALKTLKCPHSYARTLNRLEQDAIDWLLIETHTNKFLQSLKLHTQKWFLEDQPHRKDAPLSHKQFTCLIHSYKDSLDAAEYEIDQTKKYPTTLQHTQPSLN